MSNNSEAKDAIDLHDGLASDWEKKYSLSQRFRERYRKFTNLIEKHSNPNNIVFDLGCGTGIFSFFSAALNKEVIGLDGSKEMITECLNKQKEDESKSANISFIHNDINAVVEFEQDADLVVCSSVFEYLDDLDKVVDNIHSKIKAGGVIIFSLPNSQSIYRKIEGTSFKLTGKPAYYKHVKNKMPERAAKKFIEEKGFKVLQTEFFEKTPFLPGLFGARRANELFILVAQKLN